MFKKIFIALCSQRGESPSSVCKKIGISPAAFSQWDDNTVPRFVTQQRAADYFGVSVDYLLGKEVDETSDDQKIKELTELVATMDDDQFSQLAAYAKFLTKDNK